MSLLIRNRPKAPDHVRAALREWHSQKKAMGTIQSKAREYGISRQMVEAIIYDYQYETKGGA